MIHPKNHPLRQFEEIDEANSAAIRRELFQGIEQAPRTDGWAVIEGADKVTNADHLHVVRLCANPDGSASWVRHSDGTLVMGHKVLTGQLWRYRAEARKEKKQRVIERKLSRSKYRDGWEP